MTDPLDGYPLQAYMPDNDPALAAGVSKANPPAKSRAGRVKHINELLRHPACAGDHRRVRERLVNGMTIHELSLLESELEAKITHAESKQWP